MILLESSDKTKMKDIPERSDIICMPTTLNIIRFTAIFPPKGKEYNPPFKFYLKFYLLCIYSSIALLGMYAYVIKTIYGKESMTHSLYTTFK